ncbi:hypothetical protein DdX_22271 [Ditylenchus destructor]|uniref:Uncharacterized protein n=1 Tax=Ditylenchus destructor TaxID=166010 RepID=A0AAD4MDS6_9BILA|nr:hypothetical protein DdX_22271 [Ditylenchus destructor]
MKRDIAAGPQPGWTNMVVSAGGWDKIVLGNAHNPRWDKYRFQSLAAIPRAEKADPADIAWDIMLAALPKRAVALYFMMDERDIETALKQPWVSIGRGCRRGGGVRPDRRSRPSPSARLWQRCTHHRGICEAPPGADARGCGAQDDVMARASHGPDRSPACCARGCGPT